MDGHFRHLMCRQQLCSNRFVWGWDRLSPFDNDRGHNSTGLNLYCWLLWITHGGLPFWRRILDSRRRHRLHGQQLCSHHVGCCWHCFNPFDHYLWGHKTYPDLLPWLFWLPNSRLPCQWCILDNQSRHLMCCQQMCNNHSARSWDHFKPFDHNPGHSGADSDMCQWVQRFTLSHLPLRWRVMDGPNRHLMRCPALRIHYSC
mmetsp:Transcript_21128/g.35999  ORF Transcript_21128/g.35999 Transcript_21128/m.35999 type:complete len:201 (-) Transcript_21128:1494-2096(-)